eukprot:13216012-Alexandrium_andersonii.AAC.1
MESYIQWITAAQRKLQDVDPGTTISDESFAQRVLRKARLSRDQRQLVLAAAGGINATEKQ